MGKSNIKILLTVVAIILVVSCKHEPTTIEIKQVQVGIDSLKFTTFADTIINDMVVRNPDPTDAWQDSCLKDFNRKEFIDIIFKDIYKNKLLAYDYYTGKLLSGDDVKNVEKKDHYNRDIIGKFQFREAWFYDKDNHVFIKKVHSIIFGYETYDESGSVKGYKPLFKVKF